MFGVFGYLRSAATCQSFGAATCIDTVAFPRFHYTGASAFGADAIRAFFRVGLCAARSGHSGEIHAGNFDARFWSGCYADTGFPFFRARLASLSFFTDCHFFDSFTRRSA